MPGKYHIKTELDRAIHVMELLSEKDNFRNLSERVAFMHYLAKMLRRVSALLVDHKNKVCASIVDNSGIDYWTMKGAFEKCANDFRNVSDGGNLRTYDDDYLEETDDLYLDLTIQEVMDYDDQMYGESTFYKNSRLEEAHKVLLGSSVHLYERISKELGGIIGMLNDISQYEQSLPQILNDQYDNLYLEYEKNGWKTDKDKFKEHVLYQTTGHTNVLERLNRYYPIYLKEFSSSEQGCANVSNPWVYIYRHRNELSQDELHSIFYRLHCKRQLENCITYFDLVKEPQHKLVFKNKAAEELVTMLMPTILRYEGFEHSYQYVVVLMVCDDLKLTQTENSRRGLEFKDYINLFLDEDCHVKHPSTYNPYLNKLKGGHFGKLSKDNYYKTDYNDTEFEKLKDVYWYTLSLLNKVLCMEFPSVRFAGYLREEHPKTPSLKDFANASAKSIDRNKLFLLRDVLNGEIKDFLDLKEDHR